MTFLYLSKLLPLAVYPLGAALILLAIGMIAVLLGSKRWTAAALAAALALLWTASTPLLANWIYAGLETRYPPVPIDDLPAVDVAVLLAGAVSQPLSPRFAPDLNDAGDRVLHAARLWRSGKAKRILVSGGVLPWQQEGAPEAELLRALLEEFGVPQEAILVEAASRNTHENALRSAEIWRAAGFRSGLLVTSAAHMPRALAAFRKAGLVLVPASTDVRAMRPPGARDRVFDLLPQADALALTTSGLKEWIGALVYRARGWA